MRMKVQAPPPNAGKVSILRCTCYVALLLNLAVPPIAQAQQQSKPTGAELTPEPAVPAILAAFDKYEVVAMPEAHGMKDMDDFILSLIRKPGFSEKVNDIAVECGNSLYQPILDAYIAGEDVPFTEVQKVWRNTTQPMCGMSGFFEQLFPLVRAMNQKLPPGERLRVLACDPPIDWSRIKTAQDIAKFSDRDASIASVMEKEVLSKHRKALMLFGEFHLLHGGGVGPGNAVTIYEKDYPNRTFVISELGDFDTNLPVLSSSPFATWPVPSIAQAKGTWLGALALAHFFPPPIWTDKNCNVHDEFPRNEQRPMSDLVDAFLYLGPQDLRLKEQMPADIALDSVYMTELLRRMRLMGMPEVGTLKEFNQQVVNNAGNPVLLVPKVTDFKAYFPFIQQNCLDRKSHSNATQ